MGARASDSLIVTHLRMYTRIAFHVEDVFGLHAVLLRGNSQTT
jgi:hypothetical protein